VVLQGGDGSVRIRRVGRQDADGMLLEPVTGAGSGEFIAPPTRAGRAHPLGQPVNSSFLEIF